MNDYVPAEDVEAPISVNFVTGAGFDRAQLTVRANDSAQLVARLGELEVDGALDRIVEYNKAFQAKAGAAPSGPAGGNGSSTRAQGAQNSGGAAPRSGGNSGSGHDGADHPEGITCGSCNQPVKGKTIKQKKAPFKTFEMWVCPNQRARDDGHFSEFVN